MTKIFRVWLGTIFSIFILLGTLGCGINIDSSTNLDGSFNSDGSIKTETEVRDNISPSGKDRRLEDRFVQEKGNEVSKNIVHTPQSHSRETGSQQNKANEQQKQQAQSVQRNLEQEQNQELNLEYSLTEGKDHKQDVNAPSHSKKETSKGTTEEPREDQPLGGQEIKRETASSSQERKEQESLSELQEPSTLQTVTFTIIGPEDIGTILEDTEVEFKEGETVLEALKKVTREQKIQLEYRGRKGTAYIEGINNIYEFDYGTESGWLYSVNGVFPNRGAGVWLVEANDHVRWLYTIDLGKDWDAYIQEVEDTD